MAEQISKEMQKRKASKIFKKMIEQTPTFYEKPEHKVEMKMFKTMKCYLNHLFRLILNVLISNSSMHKQHKLNQNKKNFD